MCAGLILLEEGISLPRITCRSAVWMVPLLVNIHADLAQFPQLQL